MGIEGIIETLKQGGFFSFYLPFVLMFAIFYGLLTKSKIFGDPKEKSVKKINAMVSLTASFFILIFSPLADLAAFLSAFLGRIFIVLITLIFFLLICVMLIPSEEWEKERGKYTKFLLPAGIILAVIVFFTSSGISLMPSLQPSSMPQISLSNEDILTIILIFSFILIVWFVTREEKKEKPKKIIGYRPEPIYEGEA